MNLDAILNEDIMTSSNERLDLQQKQPLFPPKKREQNDDSSDDFVAIDFETMTGLRSSACAIGMVKVIDGEIVQKFYSHINPIRDKYTEKEPNRTIHGISLESAEKADTFDKLFEGIKLFIGDLPLVCHSKGADISILKTLMQYYNLSGINTDNSVCTYQLTGLSLSECSKKYNIHLARHHDALCDAEACALIYLEFIGKPKMDTTSGSLGEIMSTISKRNIDIQYRSRLSDELITDKTTPFFDATVVITGIFEKYPERNILAEKIQKLGAKITSSISKKTNLVLVGSGAGPKKIEKIQQLKADGYDIKIMREEELYNTLG